MTRDKAMRAVREAHTVLDPGAVRVAAELVHRGSPLDVVPASVDAGVDPVDKPTPARVPEWVKDPAKWQAMTRAERRATERYHRKQQRS
jgi:hypothetical protein